MRELSSFAILLTEVSVAEKKWGGGGVVIGRYLVRTKCISGRVCCRIFVKTKGPRPFLINFESIVGKLRTTAV